MSDGLLGSVWVPMDRQHLGPAHMLFSHAACVSFKQIGFNVIFSSAALVSANCFHSCAFEKYPFFLSAGVLFIHPDCFSVSRKVLKIMAPV